MKQQEGLTRMVCGGHNQPQFEDDPSYINHYLSADVDVELTERWLLLTAFHIERNIWTSGLAGDERNGAMKTSTRVK